MPAKRGGVVRVNGVTQDNSGNDRPDLEPDTGSTRYTPSSREGGDETAYDAGYDAVYDAEIVDDDPAYRGAHRRDEDDADYDVVYAGGADDAVYDEPYEDEPGERAAGGAEGGLPKRGLAMILIAVAALLALWGIWKLTQDDADDTDGAGEDAAATSSTVIGTPAASPSQDPNAQPSQPSQAPDAQATATVTDTVRADEQNAQDPNAQPDQGAEGQPVPAPAPAGATLDAASAQVYVYNNSGVPDLASRTADQLKGQFNVANDSADAAVMNMPEQVYGVFPETYVFYDPAVPGAEQVAADVAGRVGGTARAKSDIPDGASLPEQANNREAVTVVLAR